MLALCTSSFTGLLPAPVIAPAPRAAPVIAPAPRAAMQMQQDTVTYDRAIGDYGFDPLNLGTEETFAPFREAELKHGRLAMLAAVGWPLQEIFHPIIVDGIRGLGIDVTDVLMESDGRSPSLLNGGLDQLEVAPALSFAVFLASVLELKDLRARESQGLRFNEFSKSRQPGDLGFDPLNIAAGLPREEQIDFQEKELMNGRLAMVAVTFYVLEEAVFGSSVVSFTPDLFQPLIFASDFRAFMDASFGAASMDGSINGVAY